LVFWLSLTISYLLEIYLLFPQNGITFHQRGIGPSIYSSPIRTIGKIKFIY